MQLSALIMSTAPNLLRPFSRPHCRKKLPDISHRTEIPSKYDFPLSFKVVYGIRQTKETMCRKNLFGVVSMRRITLSQIVNCL